MQSDKPRQSRDELDIRIDAALRSYAEPPETDEPRIALARILEQANARRRAQPLRGWRWGLAAVASIAVVAALVALWTPHAPQPQIAWDPPAPRVVDMPAREVRLAQAPALAIRRGANAAPRPASREVASTRPLPKLDVFPTPQPLSPQEQALVTFAQHGPTAVQRAVLEDQKHWDEDTALASLQMPPQAARQQDQ